MAQGKQELEIRRQGDELIKRDGNSLHYFSGSLKQFAESNEFFRTQLLGLAPSQGNDKVMDNKPVTLDEVNQDKLRACLLGVSSEKYETARDAYYSKFVSQADFNNKEKNNPYIQGRLGGSIFSQLVLQLSSLVMEKISGNLAGGNIMMAIKSNVQMCSGAFQQEGSEQYSTLFFAVDKTCSASWMLVVVEDACLPLQEQKIHVADNMTHRYKGAWYLGDKDLVASLPTAQTNCPIEIGLAHVLLQIKHQRIRNGINACFANNGHWDDNEAVKLLLQPSTSADTDSPFVQHFNRSEFNPKGGTAEEKSLIDTIVIHEDNKVSIPLHRIAQALFNKSAYTYTPTFFKPRPPKLLANLRKKVGEWKTEGKTVIPLNEIDLLMVSLANDANTRKDQSVQRGTELYLNVVNIESNTHFKRPTEGHRILVYDFALIVRLAKQLEQDVRQKDNFIEPKIEFLSFEPS